MKAPFLIGRILFGGYFRYNGINHVRNRSSLSQYAGAKNVPKPDLAVTPTVHRHADRRSQHSAGHQTPSWARRR